MEINELACEVHCNAVAHGWWDSKRKPSEIVALIHSEWSEALEEARAGRPLVWYECSIPDDRVCDYNNTVCSMKEGVRCLNTFRKPKPEGVAVELIDGCIRILDAFDFFGVKFNDKEKSLDDLMNHAKAEVLPKVDGVSSLVAYLHYETSMLFLATVTGSVKKLPPATFLLGALGIAMAWVREQGLDPLALLLEKHEYNKTRPYKHGKKF